MIATEHPAEISMRGEISPVYAPFSSKYTFCAPSLMFVPFNKLDAALNAVNGGAIKISTSLMSLTRGMKELMNCSVSSIVFVIFQLAAIYGLRIENNLV